MFEMRLQSCVDPASSTYRRDVITEEVDMELDSDEEIDEKLDRAYENSRKQASLRDIFTGKNEPKSAITVATGTIPPLDTLSLLKAIAETGTLISPALKTQLELIQQNKPSVLQSSNPGFMSFPENPQSSMEDKLNKLIEQKAAFTSLQNQGLLSHPSFSHNPIIPILKSEHNVAQYVDTLMSPNVYQSNNPASGQSTPLLDEAPDTEDQKQTPLTPDQYNQFASYTQGLYKPIESSPIENNIIKDSSFIRDFYTPNETKKQRMDSPITLNMKVIDYKHGTSVRPATAIPPPPPITPYNETPDPLMPQQIPFEMPPNTHPTHPPNQPNPESPYHRPIMNPQQNIQMPPPPPLLNQPPLPFQQPPDNNMPPNRMPDNKAHHELLMNNQPIPPMHEQVHDMRNRDEQMPVFHGQQHPPRPSHPHFFRPPPRLISPTLEIDQCPLTISGCLRRTNSHTDIHPLLGLPHLPILIIRDREISRDTTDTIISRA